MKKVIRKFIGVFGYDFIKIKKKPFLNTSHKIKVGNYTIEMPKITPLIEVYRNNPSFNGELTRIVSKIQFKYKYLSCMDIGANCGDTASLIKTCNEDIEIICIEGDSSTFEYLKNNCNQFSKIHIYNKYLGERDETIMVNVEKKGWNSTIVKGENGLTKLKIITLDHLINVNNSIDIEKYKFLKIDTEGFDTIIVRGCTEYIKKAKPVIYLEYNRHNMTTIKENGLDTILALTKYGYDTILFFDDNGRFMVDLKLDNITTIQQLNRYINSTTAQLLYFNLCLVHAEDNDITKEIVNAEMLLT